MAKSDGDGSQPVVIKKYANRRLYNTATSSYVTLDYLCQMVKDGVDFVVYDAKTGEDITRSVLTQIIFEQESKGQNLLPISFLRDLISFYDDNLRALLPSYLEISMQNFARNQEQMRDYVKESFGETFPVNHLQEWGKENMAMFEQALNMSSPFAGAAKPDRPDGGAVKPSGKEDDSDIRDLKRRLDEMQRQLDSLLHREEE